jgi:hypothetical protein
MRESSNGNTTPLTAIIPEKAGIHCGHVVASVLDSRIRGNDGCPHSRECRLPAFAGNRWA